MRADWNCDAERLSQGRRLVASLPCATIWSPDRSLGRHLNNQQHCSLPPQPSSAVYCELSVPNTNTRATDKEKTLTTPDGAHHRSDKFTHLLYALDGFSLTMNHCEIVSIWLKTGDLRDQNIVVAATATMTAETLHLSLVLAALRWQLLHSDNFPTYRCMNPLLFC